MASVDGLCAHMQAGKKKRHEQKSSTAATNPAEPRTLVHPTRGDRLLLPVDIWDRANDGMKGVTAEVVDRIFENARAHNIIVNEVAL
jgi:hypothetical protein